MSETVAIEIVGVEGRVVELWAAELPRGADGSFATAIGNDDEGFALMVLRDGGDRSSALAAALGDAPLYDEAWRTAHVAEHVESVELVVRRPLPSGVSGRDVTEPIQNSADPLRAALDLAPSALYRITARDAAHVAHLRPRQVFGSSAFSTGPRPARTTSPSLTTDHGGPMAEVIAAIGRVAENDRLHVFRSFVEPATDFRGKPLASGGEQGAGGWEAMHRVRVSRRLREIFLHHAAVHLVYFDATVPDFKASKLKMKKGRADPFPLGGLTPSRPRGVSISQPWGFGAPPVGPDGIARVPFDYVHPEGIAWVDLGSDPRVRVSSTPLYDAEGKPAVIDPSIASVDVDAYLASVAARIVRDIASIGR
jgi:hypothetical protein